MSAGEENIKTAEQKISSGDVDRGSAFAQLLSPLRLGPDLVIPNRVIMAPMTRGRSSANGMASAIMAEYYAQRSSAGLIISEGVHTSVLARGWYRAPEIFTQEQSKSWKIVTDRVHEAGGRIFCQLWHCGRVSHSSFRDGVEGYDGETKKGVAPSPIPHTGLNGKQSFTKLPEGEADIEVPRELTLEEIEAIPGEYRNCAERAHAAGFDGVEIHSSNGFLLDTFLQSSTNHRKDEYGGSPENRFRLVGKVLEAVCEVFPSHRIGIRISPNGAYNSMGSADNHDSFLYYAKRIADMDLAYLHLTNGIGPPHTLGAMLSFDEIRSVYAGTIIANSGYDAQSAEKEIAAGSIDAVSFARLFISNPDLPERFAAKCSPLNDVAEYSVWWSTVENELSSAGYTDFPKME